MTFMKQLHIISFWIFCSLCLSAQKGIHLQVQDFKEENDSLSINYQIHISPKAIQTEQILQISLILESKNSDLSLSEIILLGKNKQKVLSRFNQLNPKEFVPASIKEDTVLIYNVKIPYAMWMDSANLVIRQLLTGYRNQAILTTYKLKDKVEISPREPYQINPALAFIIPPKEAKNRKYKSKAYLDFQVGRSVIVPSYNRNSEELLKIDDVMGEVEGNSDVTLNGLYIEGYASPDGSYSTNERLSRERAFALKEYIRSKFDLSDHLFKVTFVAEDWNSLVEMVKAGELPQRTKS